MISVCNKDLTKIRPRVISKDNNIRNYEYEINEDGFITVSFDTRYTHELVIVSSKNNIKICDTLENIKNDLSVIRNLTIGTDYIDCESIGELKSNYNAQMNYESIYIVDNASDNYKCVVADVKDCDIIKIDGTIGPSVAYSSIAIFLNDSGLVEKYIYDPDSSSKYNTTMYVNVPKNAVTVYVNGINYTPSVNKAKINYYKINYNKTEIDEKITPIKENVLDNTFCDISIFRRFGVIGDSYASGELYYNGKYHDKYFNSWGQIIARKHGTTCTNYSSGGLSTKSWLTATKGLPLLLSSEADDIYYLVLGINDWYAHGESYLGSITDITNYSNFSDYKDSFYGNYGKIIEQVQEHAPHAKLIMFTCASTDELPQKFNNAIIEIAKHYKIPYIVQSDDEFFKSNLYNNMSGGHPTSIAYSGMAVAFERLINKCILENSSYFFDLYMYD